MSNPDDPAAWVAKADNYLLNIANNLNDARVSARSSSGRETWHLVLRRGN